MERVRACGESPSVSTAIATRRFVAVHPVADQDGRRTDLDEVADLAAAKGGDDQRAQMAGLGGLIAFELESLEAGKRFLDALHMIKRAVMWRR